MYSIFVEELAKLFLKFLTDEPVTTTLVKCNSRVHGTMDANNDPRGHRAIHAFEIFFHETAQTARHRLAFERGMCSLELLCARFEVVLAAEREEVDGSEVHGVPRLVDFLDRHLQSSLVSDSTLAS